MSALPPATVTVPMAAGGVASPALALPVLTWRMAEGSEEAFREFHAGWFQRIFRYAFVLMRGNEAAARDVTQETLLRVVKHVRVFEGEDEFWGWLSCLARSAAADHGRKVSRYRRLLEKFSGEARKEAPEPELDLEEMLLRGMGLLAEEDRDLLQQKYSEGASVRQMAGRAGVSETAIESRLARVRRELRAIVFRLKD